MINEQVEQGMGVSLYNIFGLWNIPKSIALAIFINLNFYALVKIPFSQIWDIYSTTLIALALFFAYLFGIGKHILAPYKKIIIYYFCGLTILLAVHIAYAFVMYDQLLFSTFFKAPGYRWLYILFFPFIIYVFEKQNGIYKLMKLASIFVLAGMVILFLQAVLSNYYGINITAYEYEPENYRNDRLRIGHTSHLFMLVIIYSVYIFFNRKKITLKIAYGIIFSLGVFLIFYCMQTRMLTLAFSATALSVVFFSYRKNFFSKMFLICVMFFALYYVYSIGLISMFAESFGQDSKEYNSTLARIGAFEYFYDNFFLKRPLTGMGLVAVVNPKMARLVRGDFDIFHACDLGLLGLVFEMGLLGLFFYVGILARFAYILYKNRHNKNIKEYPFLVGIFVYILATSVSLMITDTFRMFMFPFCIAIFEYSHKRGKTESRNFVS